MTKLDLLAVGYLLANIDLQFVLIVLNFFTQVLIIISNSFLYIIKPFLEFHIRVMVILIYILSFPLKIF